MKRRVTDQNELAKEDVPNICICYLFYWRITDLRSAGRRMVAEVPRKTKVPRVMVHVYVVDSCVLIPKA